MRSVDIGLVGTYRTREAGVHVSGEHEREREALLGGSRLCAEREVLTALAVSGNQRNRARESVGAPLDLKQVVERHSPFAGEQHAAVVATGALEILALALLEQLE